MTPDLPRLSADQKDEFATNGFLVLRGFYDLESEIAPIQRAVAAVIDLVAESNLPGWRRPTFAAERFDAGFMELIAHQRALGGQVYDAVKQVAPVVRLLGAAKHEAVFRQLRGDDAELGIPTGGHGVRIDVPGERHLEGKWHQEYPYQFRSLDGLTFWSPLRPVGPELGPLVLCKGSHKDGVAPMTRTAGTGYDAMFGVSIADVDKVVARYEQLAPLTVPGDAIVLDFLTLHRSGVNVGQVPRWSMQLRFFNFREATGRRIAWKGSYQSGNSVEKIHPELIVS